MSTRPGSPRLLPVGGRWDPGHGAVWWRFGSATPSERPSALARRWIEEIVRAEQLFPWRGFAPVPPRAKPRFAGVANADFSVSHSGDSVLVSVALGTRVGVDVENGPYSAFASAALRRRMLAPAEQATLDVLPESEAALYLARVWTAKEAFVKATGEGQRRDFRGFTVPVPSAARSHPVEACIAVAARDQVRFLRLAPSFARPQLVA